MIKTIYVALSLVLAVMASPAPSFAAEPAGSFTVDARVALNAYQGLVEDHLASALNGLRALAVTDDVKSADWERMKGALAQLSADVPTDSAFWFAKPDGSVHTTIAGLSDNNLKDRDYFPTLMAGKDVADALVVGKTTKVANLIVATPVKKDGRVIGALGVSVSLEKFAKMIDAALGLPPGIVFYAIDKNGQVPLHREIDKLLSFPGKTGGESLNAAVKEMLSKPEGTESYTVEGVTKTAVFKKSPATGWVFVLGNAR